jgi:hypothetical protein
LACIFGLALGAGLLRGDDRRRGYILGASGHRLQREDTEKQAADQPNKMETKVSMHTLFRKHRGSRSNGRARREGQSQPGVDAGRPVVAVKLPISLDIDVGLN